MTIEAALTAMNTSTRPPWPHTAGELTIDEIVAMCDEPSPPGTISPPLTAYAFLYGVRAGRTPKGAPGGFRRARGIDGRGPGDPQAR